MSQKAIAKATASAKEYLKKFEAFARAAHGKTKGIGKVQEAADKLVYHLQSVLASLEQEDLMEWARVTLPDLLLHSPWGMLQVPRKKGRVGLEQLWAKVAWVWGGIIRRMGSRDYLDALMYYQRTKNATNATTTTATTGTGSGVKSRNTDDKCTRSGGNANTKKNVRNRSSKKAEKDSLSGSSGKPGDHANTYMDTAMLFNAFNQTIGQIALDLASICSQVKTNQGEGKNPEKSMMKQWKSEVCRKWLVFLVANGQDHVLRAAQSSKSSTVSASYDSEDMMEDQWSDDLLSGVFVHALLTKCLSMPNRYLGEVAKRLLIQRFSDENEYRSHALSLLSVGQKMVCPGKNILSSRDASKLPAEGLRNNSNSNVRGVSATSVSDLLSVSTRLSGDQSFATDIYQQSSDTSATGWQRVAKWHVCPIGTLPTNCRKVQDLCLELSEQQLGDWVGFDPRLLGSRGRKGSDSHEVEKKEECNQKRAETGNPGESLGPYDTDLPENEQRARTIVDKVLREALFTSANASHHSKLLAKRKRGAQAVRVEAPKIAASGVMTMEEVSPGKDLSGDNYSSRDDQHLSEQTSPSDIRIFGYDLQ